MATKRSISTFKEAELKGTGPELTRLDKRDDKTLKKKQLMQNSTRLSIDNKDSQSGTVKPQALSKSSTFQQKMKARTAGGPFRMINEKLYTCGGSEAIAHFSEDPVLFDMSPNSGHGGRKRRMIGRRGRRCWRWSARGVIGGGRGGQLEGGRGGRLAEEGVGEEGDWSAKDVGGGGGRREAGGVWWWTTRTENYCINFQLLVDLAAWKKIFSYKLL